MPKRLSDTEKWEKPWFRLLPVKMKCFWEYYRDRADHAGLWDVDWDTASHYIGQKVTEEEVEKHFVGKFIRVDGKFFCPAFITFQYGKLNPNVKAHNSVIKRLLKFDLIDENLTVREQLANTLASVLNKNKDTDTDLLSFKEEKNQKSRAESEYEMVTFCIEQGLPASDGEYLWHKWEGNGWVNGKQRIKDWRHTVRSWKAAGYLPSQKEGSNNGTQGRSSFSPAKSDQIKRAEFKHGEKDVDRFRNSFESLREIERNHEKPGSAGN